MSSSDVPAVIESEPQSLLEVIARAARDPNVDIDKMERLLEMQMRVHARTAREDYALALAELQPKLPVITERGRILNKSEAVQSTYAYWEDVNEAIRPLLAEHGFSLSFRTGRQAELITVTGVLTHSAGHFEETTLPLPADVSGNKNAVQSVGSSLSYGKRYTAFLLLNITTKGEDDDGASATQMRADGEPVQRAKLEGKYPSASKLKAALREFADKLGKAEDDGAVDALEAEYNDALVQCQRDLPIWWSGDGTPEKIGIAGQIRVRRETVHASATYEALLNAMRQQTSRAQLLTWAEINDAFISELEGDEGRQFQVAFDEFEAGLQLVGTVHS